MKVYLDLLFLLNFGFDFLLLLFVSYLLKRNASIKRLTLGGLVGACSIILLFFSMNSILLFIFKFGISLIMVFVTFGWKDYQYTSKNISFLYALSITLGGILYFLNVTFSYKQEGLIFYHHGLSINAYLLLFLGPFFLKKYVKELKTLKTKYSHYYQVKVFQEGKEYCFQGYLDTGNHLKEPYTGKPILLIYHKKLLHTIRAPILVPFHTISGESLLTCMKCDKVVIEGVGERHCLIGLLNEKPAFDGITCILQEQILEGNYVT